MKPRGPVPPQGQQQQQPVEAPRYQRVLIIMRDGEQIEVENATYTININPAGAIISVQEQGGERRQYLFPLTPQTEIKRVELLPSKIEVAAGPLRAV